MSRWCLPTTSSSVAFFSCPQSFPASGSFPVSWLFTSSGQSIGASALILPMNIQSWFPLGLTNFISLQSKGLSRVFSSTTIWKHLFFSIQLYFVEGNGSPLQYLLPGKCHGQRSLAGYSLWGCKEADMMEHAYSAFFMVQLSHLYMTTGKTIALTRWTFVSKVMALLFKSLGSS